MNKLSKLIILVFLISLFGCLGIFIYAGSGDNTSGFAWSAVTMVFMLIQVQGISLAMPGQSMLAGQ